RALLPGPHTGHERAAQGQRSHAEYQPPEERRLLLPPPRPGQRGRGDLFEFQRQRPPTVGAVGGTSPQLHAAPGTLHELVGLHYRGSVAGSGVSPGVTLMWYHCWTLYLAQMKPNCSSDRRSSSCARFVASICFVTRLMSFVAMPAAISLTASAC